MDFCFPSQDAEPKLSVLVAKDCRSKSMATFMLPGKGQADWVIKSIAKTIDESGYGRIILKDDGEASIIAV